MYRKSIMMLYTLAQILHCAHRTAGWSLPYMGRGYHGISSLSMRISFERSIMTRLERKMMLSSTSSKAERETEKSELVDGQEEASANLEKLLRHWRDHPAINPTLQFPTLLVPSESLQRWIQEPRLQSYLAKPSNWELLHHIHPRIKMIQEYNETHKLLLLRNETTGPVLSNTARHKFLLPSDLFDTSNGEVEFGPEKEISITFEQLSFGYILKCLLPVQPPTAYEQIGHVAHFNLKSHHAPYGPLIGEVLRETNPTIDTVVSKIGEVKGKYRTYDLELLAGPATFDTTVVEHGVFIDLNVAECYWCTRLSGERQELLLDVQKSRKKSKKLVVADVFCGVGAVCLLLAKKFPDATILANDWNPKAIEYFKQSVTKNGMELSPRFEFACGDAYDFVIDLGNKESKGIPDHIFMNFPLEAPTFLGALRWWSSKKVAKKYKNENCYPRFHVYTFARSQKAANDEEEVAVDIIANELLPEMEFSNEEATLVHRRKELNSEFGADLSTRLVRDVAPGKAVVCVTFSVTAKLLRYMQGDYS